MWILTKKLTRKVTKVTIKERDEMPAILLFFMVIFLGLISTAIYLGILALAIVPTVLGALYGWDALYITLAVIGWVLVIL